MLMTFYFDMDGTLNRFYSVPDWLKYLENEDTTPYAVAKPSLNFSLLARRIHQLQRKGYKVGIISWLSKSGTEDYNTAVATIKKTWLKKHLPSVEWDEITIIPYGTPKHNHANDKYAILFDDEKRNRDAWQSKTRMAFDESHIMEILAHFAKSC